MRWLGLLLILATIGGSSARTLPLGRYQAAITPLAITQDREGLLWLATTSGVVRFDGLHFDPMTAPAGMDLSRVTHLAAATDGAIWMATEKGLIRYRDGAFAVQLPLAVKSLLLTRAGRLLVADDRNLYIFPEPAKDPGRHAKLANITVNGEFHEDLSGVVRFGCSTAVCEWSDADVLAAASGKQLVEMPRFYYNVRETSRKEVHISSEVLSAPDRRIWIRNGLELLRLENRRAASRYEIPGQRFNGQYPRCSLDHHGRLWIPGHRLHVIENGAMRAFAVTGAPLEEVSAVFEDRQGTLWLGLAGKGLAALPDEGVLETFSEPEGITGSVLDLARHPRLGLIAATNSGGFVFDEKQRAWRALGVDKGGALRSVAGRDDGALVLLPYRGGVLLSREPFRTDREAPLPAGFEPKRLRKVLLDGRGTVWLGTTQGLYRLDADERVVAVPLPGKGTHASDLLADRDGALWVGYEGGVARCAGGDCMQVIATKDGLLLPEIRTIAPGEQEIWIGYRRPGGFSRLERKGGRWVATHFKPQDGFGPPDTHFLRRDRRGWIWRGAEDGVYVSDGKHVAPEDWIHLTFGDRVNAAYANMYGFLEEADGSIWIGTQVQAVHIRPRDDWFADAAPRLAPVSGPVQPDVEFRVSNPRLPPFQSRLFRYRLQPADAKWRFSSDGRLRYAGLRRGAYRLQIASGNGGALLEQTLRVGTDSGGGTILWFSLAGAAAAALSWAIVRRRRIGGKALETEDYWREKRQFLEERDRADAADGPAEDWSGRTLADRFSIETRVASGGFASVYRAADTANGGEAVAVKLLHPLRDNEQWRRRRFAEEVASLQKVDHPGIVRIRYAGEAAPDRPYLVMEFVEGVTLRSLLAAGPLEYERAARILEQIGAALAAAHRARILHRDVKPENVMVCDAGPAGERIKLIDFGIASIRTDEERTNTTRLAGSPGYLAPERWIGLETCASDVYSMAAIAWEMLTGRAYRHGTESNGAGLPQSVAELLSRGVAYDPADRPQDAEAFAAEVAAQLTGCRR